MKNTHRLYSMFMFGVFVLVLFGGLLSYAMQSGTPTDVTATAKITPTSDGFRVDFPEPTPISEISYAGDFNGPVEVFDGSPDNSSGIPEALDLINRALQVDPKNAVFLDTKGLILLKDGKPQDAIPLFEQAVDLTCEGPIYVLHLAFAQLKNDSNADAATTFNKVRALLVTRSDSLPKDSKSMFDELDMKLGPSL